MRKAPAAPITFARRLRRIQREKNRARIDLVKFLFFESAFCAVLPYFGKTETIENSEIRPRNYM